MQNQPKVAIIGAGPGGILACKHLKGQASITCFEGGKSYGGQWLREEPLNEQQQSQNAFYKYYQTHYSSLYKGLKSNLPYQLMTFKGFPHQKKYETGYIEAEEFLEYLQQYVKHHDLEQYMKFNTFVQKVGKIESLDSETKNKLKIENNEKFYIQVCQTDNIEKSEYFTANFVMVCNGHNISPFDPEFENRVSFQGKIFHCHDLLDETADKEFAGKKVVLQGSRASALDQINYLCTLENKPKQIVWVGFGQKEVQMFKSPMGDFAEYIQSGLLTAQPGRIQKSEENSKTLILTEGAVIEDVDVIVQATGYKYTYPFLNSNINEFFGKEEESFIEYGKVPENESETNFKYFGPVYKRIFAINEPNLMFIGLMERVLGIQQLLERIVIAATQYVTGKVQLPSKQDMLEEWKIDIESVKATNPNMRTLFQISTPAFPEQQYVSDLAKFSNIPLDMEFQKLTGEAGMMMMQFLMQGKFVSIRKESLPNQYVPQEGLF